MTKIVKGIARLDLGLQRHQERLRDNAAEEQLQEVLLQERHHRRRVQRYDCRGKIVREDQINDPLCIAQRQHSCSSPSSPGFDSRHSRELFSLCC